MATGKINLSKCFSNPTKLQSGADLDSLYGEEKAGIYNLDGVPVDDSTAQYGFMIVAGYNLLGVQIFIGKNKMLFRGRSGNPQTWGSWHTVTFT